MLSDLLDDMVCRVLGRLVELGSGVLWVEGFRGFSFLNGSAVLVTSCILVVSFSKVVTCVCVLLVSLAGGVV